MVRKNRVAYFYDPEIGNYYYAPGHPMKPHRIRMAHNLILNYRVYEHLNVYRPFPASKLEMTKFHSDDYIDFLEAVTPQTLRLAKKEAMQYNLDDDSPVFDGLFEFSQKSVGGSVGGAIKINQGQTDVAINWAGGLHHAKKSQASGFCYVNDIVLGILELLKVHYRVLYCDIDIHHGDGVEEAFLTTDRVMTASFHKYGDYFPGTGSLKDIGVLGGKYHAVNVPLNDGINDESYAAVFQPVMTKIMETFQPGAILMQCGTDSLVGDRLGTFNLSIEGHSRCVQFLKSFGVPVILVGGGGYTIRNVSRCWANETALMAGIKLSNELPLNDYYEYFGPDHHLHISPSNMEDLNTPQQLHDTKTKIFENLRHVSPPSVQIGGAAAAGPRDPMISEDLMEEDHDQDEGSMLDITPDRDGGSSVDALHHQDRHSHSPSQTPPAPAEMHPRLASSATTPESEEPRPSNGEPEEACANGAECLAGCPYVWDGGQKPSEARNPIDADGMLLESLTPWECATEAAKSGDLGGETAAMVVTVTDACMAPQLETKGEPSHGGAHGQPLMHKL